MRGRGRFLYFGSAASVGAIRDTRGMASTGEAGRLAGIAGLTSLAAAVALREVPHDDWPIAQRASAWLLDGGFDVYARIPEAQMGPLALVVAALPWPVYVLVVTALLPALILIAGHRLPKPNGWHYTAAALVGFAWHRFAVNGHADDALVLTGLAVILAGIHRDRPWWAVAGFVLGIAAKPTAVVFLPLVFLRSPRHGVYATAAAAAVWLPFVLADVGGFLEAGRGMVLVSAGSLPDFLGYDPMSPFPAWVRPVQLGGGLALCWVVARRVSPEAAAVVVLTWRAALEPGVFPPYCALVAVAALLFDMRRPGVPVVTLLAAAAWWVNFMVWPVAPEAGGALRLWLLACVAVVALDGRLDRDGVEARRGLPRLELSR